MKSGIESKDYLKSLSERSKNKRVSKNYQLIGLEIADLLEDRAHKALYIKLAKQQSEQKLRALAKNVAERKNIKNKGAYFMHVLYAKDE